MTSTGATGTNIAAKAAIAERTALMVNSTAQLMRQLRDSSHSQAGIADELALEENDLHVNLRKHSKTELLRGQKVSQLPKELAGKVSNIKNTGKVLYQMPSVVLSLDAHLDEALKNASHIEKLKELLALGDEIKPQ